jgi:CHAT domain-containing protein
MTGDGASEPNVRHLVERSAPQGFKIVHFATHALYDTPLSQRVGLALARSGVDGTPRNDGVIDAFEIGLEWEFDADLVTLSGCHTASGFGNIRDEPTGLSGALHAAGARSVVASLWNVDDLATALLMGRFYENLKRSESATRENGVATKAFALAEAKRWLREFTDKNGSKPFAHPTYWSGFILTGDPN